MNRTAMTQPRLWFLVAGVLAVDLAGPGRAGLIPGGGRKKTDCYVEFDVAGATGSTNRITCGDGDPSCDDDGICDGVCHFRVALCANQTNIARCTPAALGDISVRSVPKGTILPLPAGNGCGYPTEIAVPIELTGRRIRPGKLKLIARATTSGRRRRDVDRVVLTCERLDHPCGVSKDACPRNVNGGPDELAFVTRGSGTDFDIGWAGTSHSFPFPQATALQLCLTGCDASTNPVCDATVPIGAGSINGTTFGPPLPLIAASVPLCVVNRYQGPPSGKFNVQTGEVPADSPLAMNLFADVHLTVPTQVCPRCTGFGTTAIGAIGTCDSGASEGQACTVDSLITVAQAEGDENYTLSRDCPPSPGQLAATLPLQLKLTTGTATLTGPTPCPGQTSDDACQGSPCNAGCTGDACVTMVPDPVTGNPVCRDAKGGISQLCCAGDTSIPCFPTAGGGSIVRTGIADPPKPVWPDRTSPKTSARSVLVATFCTTGGETATIVGDGLPGPGAIILPVTETLLVAATP